MTKNTAPYYIHFIYGNILFRLGFKSPRVCVVAEALDKETKEFKIDNRFINIADVEMDAIEITKEEFIDECLKRGVKPPKENLLRP